MFQSIGQTTGWSPRCGKSKSFIYFNSCSLISFIQILHLAQSCCELWFQSGNLFHFQCFANVGYRVPSSRHRAMHIWWHNLKCPSPPQVQDCGGLKQTQDSAKGESSNEHSPLHNDIHAHRETNWPWQLMCWKWNKPSIWDTRKVTKFSMCLPQIGKGKRPSCMLMKRVGINTRRLLMMNLRSFWKETQISPSF